MPSLPFKTLFCERFNCPEAEYETVALRRCLRWQAKLLFAVVSRLHPEHFEVDRKFIRNLGQTTGVREVHREVLDFADAVRARKSFLRTGLNIRASGGKAMALAQDLFHAH